MADKLLRLPVSPDGHTCLPKHTACKAVTRGAVNPAASTRRFMNRPRRREPRENGDRHRAAPDTSTPKEIRNDLDAPNKALRIIPIGGMGEIGKNMFALEYEDEILLIDGGLAFPDADMLGVDILVPRIDWVIENASPYQRLGPDPRSRRPYRRPALHD